MSMFSETTHLILDLGSSTIKCGFNGDDVPRVVIPNVIGKQKKGTINILQNCNNKSQCYFGNDALYNSSILDITYPKIKSKGKIETGEKDLEVLEDMLNYIFTQQLKKNPGQFYIFLVDSLYTTTAERAAIASILYEKFSVYNLHFEPQSVMTLYSTAKTTGLIVDSGELMTEFVPIYEGFVIPMGVQNTELAGQKMTQMFLRKYKYIFDIYNVSCPTQITKKIKEMYMELLPNKYEGNVLGLSKDDDLKVGGNKEDKDNKDKNNNEEINKEYTYVLPDGNSFQIGQERYEIPEILFAPDSYGLDLKSIPELAVNSIEKCDLFLRKELYNTVILGGGNTLIKGFSERLHKDMCAYANSLGNSEKTVKIQAFDDRNFSAWLGASGLCSLGNFQSRWISKPDFDEIGERVFELDYLKTL